MSRIVVDADGLIKLGKSGVLHTLARAHELLVPEEVYREAVVEGKRMLHEDAFELEAEFPALGIEVAEVGPALEAGGSVGAGELAALRLYEASGAGAVISDDRAFANFLVRQGVPVFASADALVVLVESGRLSADQGIECLERLQAHIRGSVFESAMASIKAVAARPEGEGGVNENGERGKEQEENEDGD